MRVAGGEPHSLEQEDASVARTTRRLEVPDRTHGWGVRRTRAGAAQTCVTLAKIKGFLRKRDTDVSMLRQAAAQAARQRAEAIDAELARERAQQTETSQEEHYRGGYQWRYFADVPLQPEGYEQWDPEQISLLGLSRLGEILLSGDGEMELGLPASGSADERPTYATVLRREAREEIAAVAAKRAAKAAKARADTAPPPDERTREELIGKRSMPLTRTVQLLTYARPCSRRPQSSWQRKCTPFQSWSRWHCGRFRRRGTRSS